MEQLGMATMWNPGIFKLDALGFDRSPKWMKNDENSPGGFSHVKSTCRNVARLFFLVSKVPFRLLLLWPPFLASLLTSSILFSNTQHVVCGVHSIPCTNSVVDRSHPHPHVILWKPRGIKFPSNSHVCWFKFIHIISYPHSSELQIRLHAA